MAFDAGHRYTLDPRVALRPEPFGALAYHYGSRRLTFLRSPLLVDVVRSLPEHPSAAAAVDAVVPEARRPGFVRALAALADSAFLVPDAPSPAPIPSEHTPLEHTPPEPNPIEPNPLGGAPCPRPSSSS